MKSTTYIDRYGLTCPRLFPEGKGSCLLSFHFSPCLRNGSPHPLFGGEKGHRTPNYHFSNPESESDELLFE